MIERIEIIAARVRLWIRTAKDNSCLHNLRYAGNSLQPYTGVWSSHLNWQLKTVEVGRQHLGGGASHHIVQQHCFCFAAPLAGVPAACCAAVAPSPSLGL